MDDIQYSDQLQDQNQYENDEVDYDYANMENQYQLDLDIYAKRSSAQQHYAICSAETIYAQIDKQVQDIMAITCLQYAWAFQLYYLCNWAKAPIYKLMDIETSFKKVIYYHSDYQPSETQDTQLCEVCYQQVRLINNCCSHKYCRMCWTQLLDTSLKISSELIPKCQGQNCQQLMNYKLIQYILNLSSSIKLRDRFDRLKVLLYSRKNNSVKMCPNPYCQKNFLVFDLTLKPIWCPCGLLICTYCGVQNHFPIDCAERENWQKIRQQLQKQWLEVVKYKICPACKDPIQKNQGCNHMTCRCKHQFCWICLKNWKTHGVCQGIDAHEKMEAQRQKMLKNKKQYREKFYSAQQQFQRLLNYEKRLKSENPQKMKDNLMSFCHIPVNETYFLTDLKNQILIGIQFCKYCVIYEFFRGQIGQKYFEIYSHRIQKQIDELDAYLKGICDNYEQLMGQQNDNQIKDAAKNNLMNQLCESKRRQMIQKQSRSQQFLLKLIQRK